MKLQQILEDYEVDVPIYRGMKLPSGTEEGDIIRVSARQDRRPKDATIMASMLFNYGIQCRFGVPDVRKTSVFAAGSYNIAKSYTAGVGRGVVQVQLPANAMVIYNRDIADSLGVLERANIKEFIMYMGKYIDDPTVDQYVNQNSGELFHELASEAIEDGEEFVEVMRIFEDLALEITANYVAERAGDLEPSMNTSIEYMINGVIAYNAKVIEIVKPPSAVDVQVDDDNIPF